MTGAVQIKNTSNDACEKTLIADSTAKLLPEKWLGTTQIISLFILCNAPTRFFAGEVKLRKRKRNVDSTPQQN
jgi:hypothetical protein